MYNARSETVTEKKTFAEHVLTRRCAVPLMGWFEGSARYPNKDFLHMDYTSGLMYIAGIYKTVNDYGTGKEVPVYCILTQDPEQPEVEAVHDRMPLLIEYGRIKEWLSCGTSAESVKSFISAQKTPLMALVKRASVFGKDENY